MSDTKPQRPADDETRAAKSQAKKPEVVVKPVEVEAEKADVKPDHRKPTKPLVTGIGGVVPVFDAGGNLHVAPHFFTDPHVSGLDANYPVRRHEKGGQAPYVVLPAGSGAVAFRTGIVITGDFEDFTPLAAVMGEGVVTDVETRQGELYLLIRPFGGGAATVVEGVGMASMEITA